MTDLARDGNCLGAVIGGILLPMGFAAFCTRIRQRNDWS
jgi:hypothetical protein